MAYKFDFKDVYAEMEIAGNSYKVNCNSKSVINAMNDFAEGCERIAMESETVDNEKTAEAGMTAMEAMIDTVLGEGETDRIFVGRVKNYNDMYDLAMFICNSVNDTRNGEPIGGNRSQRRAAGRGKKRGRR